MRTLAAFVSFFAVLLLGCGSSEKKTDSGEGLAQRAGEKVGEAVTDFSRGVGAGVDTTLTIPLELSADLQAKGISKTAAKTGGAGISKSVTVYLIASKPFNGELLAKAFDKDGQEIGRAKTKVELGADDAKYITFNFDSRMDSNLVVRFSIGAAGTQP